ncbi:hypothetical protein [Microbacterium aurantiacum]|uniref:hypothetical protein n=1 Tax=Microbacterium aurantiacum TaxID=162393 RepID=UPI000C80BA60|nr:hypothetical protein [Microbacterium aurantiacum]
MAFTRDELARGAFSAWGIFMGLMLGGLIIMFIGSGFQSAPTSGWGSLIGTALGIGLFAGIIGGVISLLAMALGMPVAWLLGRALRRVAALGIHLLVYSAFGIVIGAAAMWAVSLLFPGGVIENSVGWIVAGSAFVAVPAGWWLTARSALREDRGWARRRRSAADRDAEFEDAAVSRTDEL